MEIKQFCGLVPSFFFILILKLPFNTVLQNTQILLGIDVSTESACTGYIYIYIYIYIYPVHALSVLTSIHSDICVF